MGLLLRELFQVNTNIGPKTNVLCLLLWLLLQSLAVSVANAQDTLPNNLIWGKQLSISSNLSSRDARFPLAQINDKITSDAYPYNGFASGAFVGTITINLDKNYTLNGLMLWNDINVQIEGIAEFSLHFYNATGIKIGSSSLFTAPVGKLTPSTYTFDTIEGVRRVDLVISNTHGFRGIEIREIALLNALPENYIGGLAITPTSTISPRGSRFPLAQLVDQIASDASPFNGFAAYAFAGTISLNLDKDYTLTAFMLWNDINVQNEGISSFSLEFFDSYGKFIGKSNQFTPPLRQLTPSTFTFPPVANVRRVDLVIANSYGAYGIEIRELGFIIQPDWAKPGDKAAGKQQFAALCAGCHGAEGKSTYNPINLDNLKSADARINVAKFIFENMPKGNPTACTNSNNDNCAANVTAYLKEVNQITKGAAIWEAQCKSCHGTFDFGISNGNRKINATTVNNIYNNPATSGTYTSLADFIAKAMPKQAPANCGNSDDCAINVTAFITSQIPKVELSCENTGAPIYGKRKLTLLTSRQYQKSLEDLLGVTSNYGAEVASNDQVIGGFPNMDARAVLETIATTYIDNAEKIAAWAISRGKPFSCTDAMACANQFVSEFAFKVFRRPLTATEKTAYTQIFATYGAKQGLEIALTAALSSPQFLYRSEVGVSIADAKAAGYYRSSGAPSGFIDPLVLADADAYVLTPYEFATALSYMFAGTTPDITLLNAAKSDALTTPAQIQAQVVRLIESARGKDNYGDFVGTWFSTDDVMSITRPTAPNLTSDVRAAMAAEVREHFKYVFYTSGVPFNEFYNSNYTFLNKTLADYYGVTGSFDGNFVKTKATGRGGPIASGAFMTKWAHADRTSPIKRAVHSRKAALCHHIEPPNSSLAAPNIDQQRAAALAAIEAHERALGMPMSSKDFYFTLTNGITACAQCHERIINPMFGMEDFDNAGRLRRSAGSGQVYEELNNASLLVTLAGTLNGVESVDDPTSFNFIGAKDFSNKIASTDAIQTCLVNQGFRYTTGLAGSVAELDTTEPALTEEQQTDFGCAKSAMKKALIENGQSAKAMFTTLGTLDLIRFRK